MTVGNSTGKGDTSEDKEVYEDAIHITEEDIVDTGYFKIQNSQSNPGAEFMRYCNFVAPHLCLFWKEDLFFLQLVCVADDVNEQ